MKLLKYFFGMLLLVSVMNFVSCKDDDNKKPVVGDDDYPTVAKVDGKITIFAKFEVEPCADIVLAGSYKLKPDSESDWSTNVAELTKFVKARKIGDKDWGADGWYEVTIDIPASAAIAANDKHSDAILGAKPVQLESGEFDWSYQIGYDDPSDITVKSGSVEVVAGFSHEGDIFFTSNATAAIIFKKWKADPCKVVKHDYTFNVTVPAGTPDNADVYIVGDMNKWVADANKLTKAGGKYSVTINNVREGASYKYVLNASWNYEELDVTGEEGCANAIDNRSTGTATTINDEVKNWKKITVNRCGDYPDVDAEDGKITIFAKFETELCGEVGLVGTHNGFSDDPANLPRFKKARQIGDKNWGDEGWWEITVDLNESTAFDWGEKGRGVLSAKPIQLNAAGEFSWDYQIGYNEAGDVEKIAGGVDVWDNGGGQCDLLFRTNVTAVFVFKKWVSDPCAK